MKTLSTFKAIFFTFILIMSCTPEDGQDGLDGQDGADGAVVTASDWMPIEFTTINNDETNAIMDIPVGNLQEFAEEGGVCLLYLRGFQTINGTWEVFNLPFYADTYSYQYTYGIHDGIEGFRFKALSDNGALSNIESTPDFAIKYVLIPVEEALIFNTETFLQSLSE